MTPPAAPVFRVLSISCSYPTPYEPGRAPFIRSRIHAMASVPGVEVRVVGPVPVIDYSQPDGDLFAGLRAPGRRQDGPVEVSHPRWLFPPMGTPWNVLCLAWHLLPHLVRLRRRFPFQVIDAHFGYPDGAAAAVVATLLGCPFTVTIRGNEPVFARMRPRRACMEWAFRRAARVIAVSDELRSFAISLGTPTDRAITIPNGIDAAMFHPRDGAECRRRHGIDPDARVILSAGGLGPGKGHHRVIQAVKALNGRGIRTQLVIAGSLNRDGRFSRQLHEMVSELALGDQARFAGHVPPEGLAELMSAADLLCLASSAEGWPNVVNEALACGVPVVATRVGAVPQLLPSPDYGLIVPVDDQAALDDALAAAFGIAWDRAAIARWGGARSWNQVGAEVIREMRLLAP